ncbi:MAG: ABC transporter ATP-binding protein [Nitrososphaerota archaeon]
MNTHSILVGRKIVKKFGGLTALFEVSFEVEKGEIFGIIGPNGSGKTTLINCIAGFYKPEAGDIMFNGIKINGLQPSRIARLGIGRTFQFPRPYEQFTVFENIMVGVLYGAGETSTNNARSKAKDIIDFVCLNHCSDTIVSHLTLVDRRRLEIARALSIAPKLILLDEVFAGLNEREVKDGIELVLRINKELGITILMIEHVLKAVKETCSRVMVLDHGQKIAEGKYEDIVRDKKVIEAYLGATYAKCV